ncbi:MAG: peptidyl-prolyl cis-trans isomerase [Methylotenera sp.]|nr:peptidyl-prolyl cis-trans isomerase [Methylotenera sp.]
MRKFFFSIALMLCSVSVFAANPQVLFETNQGNFVIELYPDKAPKTVANFMQYVKSDFYKETIFHRVINGFMIQGGGFTAEMQEKPTLPPIKNEAANGLTNDVGTIAMARTADPHSATAQFFINLMNNHALNYQSDADELIGYCVFGRVLTGMEVVREIAIVPTGNYGYHYNVPKTPIIIKQVNIKEVSH